MKKVTWGILGTGRIAHDFVKGLRVVEDAELVAVASRNINKAIKFKEESGAKKAYGSYEELVKDDEIDVVYIATPHPFHYENSVLAINHGKAVLCEKPFTINAKEAEKLIDLAREKKIYVMEAMWTRFFPAINKVKQWVYEGKIGEVKRIMADFSFKAPGDHEGRLLNLNLGGGALLDVGIYTVTIADIILNCLPIEMKTSCIIGETGADLEDTVIFKYPGDKTAVLNFGLNVEGTNDAWILGTEGKIHIENFWKGDKISLYKDDKLVEAFHEPLKGNGYEYEALEVCRNIKLGKLESSILPLDKTRTMLQLLDKIRQEWNLKYPTEV